MLGVMLALLGGVLAWLLVVRPLESARQNAKERYAQALGERALAEARAAEIARLGAQKRPALAGPADSAVSASAAAAGLPLSQIRADGPNRVTVTLAAVRPQPLFDWAARLEQGQGLVVDRFSATANADRTLAAEISFRARR